MYTRDANIVLLVYDISSKASFEHLPEWIRDLANIKLDEVIFALVGNKNDLEDKREVSTDEGLKYAEENNYIFEEISAKTGNGFPELFYKKIFEKIRVKFRPAGQQPSPEVKDVKFNIEQEEKKPEKKRRCC